MKRGQWVRIAALTGVLLIVGQAGAKNLIQNGEFDDGLAGWNSGWINTGAGVVVDFVVNSEWLLSGENCWQIDVLNGGGTDYYIQRVQNLPLETGVTYTLTFMGMMEGIDLERDITVTFENGEAGGYHRYLSETITLTNDPTEYGPFEHTAEVDDPAVQLKFFFGGGNDVTIFIDAIVVDDGEDDDTAVDSRVSSLPGALSLEQNYPNPFNPDTRIHYTLPSDAHVRLTVYDTRGKAVANPVDRLQTAGSHIVHFDGRDLPSGAYICRLEAGSKTLTRKMMLIK